MPLDNITKRATTYKPKERVRYKMIKEYIEAKYGFKVHTAYIKEIICGQRKMWEKPDFTRVTEVVESCQMCWISNGMQHICNKYATRISMICIGHFSVRNYWKVLFLFKSC